MRVMVIPYDWDWRKVGGIGKRQGRAVGNSNSEEVYRYTNTLYLGWGRNLLQIYCGLLRFTL